VSSPEQYRWLYVRSRTEFIPSGERRETEDSAKNKDSTK
jgi:hypothetical protein